MRTSSLLSAPAVAIALLCIGSCGRHDPAPKQTISYASVEPGSDATPTSDASFQLMQADPMTRLASLGDLVVHAGNRCSTVTKGLLEGGLDGTDEWRVECADSGTWQIWFRPDSAPEVDHCANAKCA
jgi:hypothetical protein